MNNCFSKIIMVTALDEFKEVSQSFRDQCDAYIVKPISKGKLVEELSKLGLFEGTDDSTE